MNLDLGLRSEDCTLKGRFIPNEMNRIINKEKIGN